MNDAQSAAQIVRFGTFEVNLHSHELRKHGMRIRLEEKPFQILELLLERAGHVVTRRALREKLWPDTVVGYEHGLNTAVNKLRDLLGDSARSPRFVETLPGLGYRFIALADDNFYPVSLTDLQLAERQNNHQRLAELKAIRNERFELMSRLAALPKDMCFFTQITMEAAEDPQFLDAMRAARIKGALVGVEAVTPEGLKAVYKEFNCSGEELVRRLQQFRNHDIHILGSFIVGLPSDRQDTFDATLNLAHKADLTFAQFVMLTPFPGTVDFERWEKAQPADAQVQGVPIVRYWLIPPEVRPKMFMPHPLMSSEEMRERTQGVWDRFYSIAAIWRRSRCTPTIRARLAFIFISKLYRQMYASTGIATDSARRNKAGAWARWLAKPCRRLFVAGPMPELQVPVAHQPALWGPEITSGRIDAQLS